MTRAATRAAALLLWACLLGFAGAARAAAPDKPITIIVPSGPGGGADFMARTFGSFVTRKHPELMVVIDDRPGAGGIVGTLAAKAAAPDGHTFLLSTNSTHAANVSLYRNLRYDPLKDFEPVGMMGSFGSVLLVTKSSAWVSTQQLIDYARAHPGRLNYGFYSSSSQVPSELMRSRADLKFTGVAYSAVGQIIVGLIGGQIDFAFIDTLSAAPALQNDKLRPLAVSTRVPVPSLEQLPPVANTLPDFEVAGWYGLTAPRGTPRPAIERMNALLEEAIKDPDTVAAMRSRGVDVGPMTPQRMRAFIEEDVQRWARWVKLAGIQPQ